MASLARPAPQGGFRMIATAGGRRFKGRLLFALDGRARAPGARAWTEIALFERGRAGGGYVVALRARRAGLGLADLDCLADAATLGEAAGVLEGFDPTAQAPAPPKRVKSTAVIAAIAARAGLDALSRAHAALVDEALAALQALERAA